MQKKAQNLVLFVVIPYLTENQQSNKATTLLVITNNTYNSQNTLCCPQKISVLKGKELLYIDNVFNAWTYGLLTVMRGVSGEV